MGLAPRFEKPRRSFRINVSADAKDLYIGSFRIKCIGRERGLGIYPLSCSDDIAVTLENSVAAQRMDVDAGTLVSVPTGPYGGSLDGAIAALPNQVQLRKRWRVTVPDWSRFAVTESCEVKYPTAGDAVAGLGVAAAGGAVEGLIVGTGAIVPLAALALASGRDRLNRWTPCVSDMHAAIQDADLEATFRGRLNVHSQTSSAGADTSGRLSADVQRVILRKCTAPKTYCVEVSIRIRVHLEGEAAYDRVLVYSSREGRYGEGRWPGHDYWETPVEPISTCREIGDYCGPEGQQRAVREVETALDAIAAAAARDLTVSSNTPRS